MEEQKEQEVKTVGKHMKGKAGRDNAFHNMYATKRYTTQK